MMVDANLVQYRVSDKAQEAFLLYMDKLASEIEEDTGAPPDAAAVTAVAIVEIFLESIKKGMEDNARPN